MHVRVGTSGFAYKEWKGTFYPEDLKNADMLAYYAGRFGSVEINNTYYRMPSEKVLGDWASQVPDGFTFVLKANRQITHFKRLKEDAYEPMEYFCSRATTLGERLGPVLFQLPPNLKQDVPRLTDFLAAMPSEIRPAFEFRHPSWLTDETYDALRGRDAALVIAQTEEEETPLVATASWGYLRLRKVEYDEGEVEAWAERVAEQDWSESYVFFKHEDEGTGPALAARFLSAATARVPRETDEPPDESADQPLSDAGDQPPSDSVGASRARSFIQRAVASTSSSSASSSVRPERLSTWNEWSPPSMTCSVASSPRSSSTGLRRSSPASRSRVPCTKSMGRSTAARWAARSVLSRPGAWSGNPRKTSPSTSGSAPSAAACDVIRPPNDFPPANRGRSGHSTRAASTAASTVACATAGRSGRLRPASM